MSKNNEIISSEYFDALEKIKKQIVIAQYQTLTAANVEKNLLYWQIGRVILEYRLSNNISEEFLGGLPSIEDIERRINM